MLSNQSLLSDIEKSFLDSSLKLLSDNHDKNEGILEKAIAYIICLTFFSEGKFIDSFNTDHIQRLPSTFQAREFLDIILKGSEVSKSRSKIIKKILLLVGEEKCFHDIKIDRKKLLDLHNQFPFNIHFGSRLLSIVVENFSIPSVVKKKRGIYYTLPVDAELISLQASFRFFQSFSQKMTDETLLNLLLSKSSEKRNFSAFPEFPTEINILDPACGSGVFLVQIAKKLAHFGNMTNNKLKIVLWGMDLDPIAILVSQLRLLLLELFLEENHKSDLIQINTSLSCGDFLLENITKRFDLIIGNPPYVRHEDIGIKHSPEYKKTLQVSLSKFLEPHIKLDRKSDYLIYFCLKSLSLLDSNGVLAFLTSNAWLEVKYGKTLQDQLISLLSYQYLSICEIINQAGSRFWKKIGINSVIFLASRSVKKSVLNGKIYFTESNKDLYRISKAILKKGVIFCREYASEDYRTEAISIDELKTTHKWAGNFLRASKEERKIFKKIGSQGSPLSSMARVQFGIKTGANDFFHVSVEKSCENEHLVEITNGQGFRGKIECDYLLPLIKSPLECKGFVIPEDFTPKRWLFMCQKSRIQLKSTDTLTYIQWGENKPVSIKQGRRSGTTVKGFHLLRSLGQRDPWYTLPAFSIPDLLWIKSYHNRPGCLLNQAKVLPDQRFYSISINNSKFIPLIFSYLNSSFIWAQMEKDGNTNMGFGVLDTNVYWLRSVRIPTNLTFKQNQTLNSIYNELICETTRTAITTDSYVRKKVDQFFAKLLEISEEEFDTIHQFIKKCVTNRLNGNAKDN